MRSYGGNQILISVLELTWWMGQVLGRRGGPRLPLGTGKASKEVALSCGLKEVESSACFSFLHLGNRQGGQVGLSFYLQSTSCPESVGGVLVFLE